jgi:hypothetical protein
MKAKVMKGGMKAVQAKDFGAVSAEQKPSGVAPKKNCPPAVTEGYYGGFGGPSRDNVRPPKVSKSDYPRPQESSKKLY